MDIIKQVELGVLICPLTKHKLFISPDRQWLITKNKSNRYKLKDEKIPILLSNPEWAEEYASDSSKMNEEYSLENVKKHKSFFNRIKQCLTYDYKTTASKNAFLSLFNNLSEDALCLSIGGGPTRAHKRLTNVNIGPFPNVDVVADAHQLPYADNSIDAVHSDAVFEHLQNPVKAAEEIYRVMKPGSKAYISTPFMQAYHGYPHHFQNFTITGHKLLFTSVGFEVLEAGTSVGPVYTIVNLISTFIYYYLPMVLRVPLRIIWGGFGVLIRPLDKIIGNRNNSYILASTTYVVIKKI